MAKTTEQMLNEMVKENTGAHFLDSGSFAGRHWQQNQGRSLASEPSGKAVVDSDGDVMLTMSLYHYLAGHANYDESLDRQFHVFAERPENKDKKWDNLMEEWIKLKKFKREGEGNTYNHDNMLDQDFYHAGFTKESSKHGEEFFAFVRTHNGADARGGYSTPHIFSIGDEDQYGSFLFDIGHGSAFCNRNGDHHWYTENGGYSWEFAGSSSDGKEFDWEDGVKKVNGRFYCPCGGKIYFAVQANEETDEDAPYYDPRANTYDKYTKYHKPEFPPPPGKYPPVKPVPYGAKPKGRKPRQFYLPGIKKG